jgi:ubiquinone/menaquinone biosynthesis C-methylase UbiE
LALRLCWVVWHPRLAPLSEHRILDAGCGTGNYIQALKGKVGDLCGLEFNEGMLAQAQEKFRKDSNVWLKQGSLLEPLKYDTNTFDGMMCNQVLHHLVTESGSEDFPQILQLIEEAHRVLRPRGVFVINTSGHKQLYDGYWWADLIPDAMGRVAKRLPTIEFIVSALKEIGFRMGGARCSSGCSSPRRKLLGSNRSSPQKFSRR